MPFTVSKEVGVVVPMPILPNLSSKITESVMKELLLLKPIHFVKCPIVPLPCTFGLTTAKGFTLPALGSGLRLPLVGVCACIEAAINVIHNTIAQTCRVRNCGLLYKCM